MSVLRNGYESLRELGLGADRGQRLDRCMRAERHVATVSQLGQEGRRRRKTVPLALQAVPLAL